MDPRRLVERVLYLKTLPLFAEASPDELATLADRATEQFVAPGAALVRSGEFANKIWFVVEGAVATSGSSSATSGPRAVLGVGPVFERRSWQNDVIASGAVRTFSLPADDLFDSLEDHFALARAFLRELARAAVVATPRIPAQDTLAFGSRREQLLDKIILLKRVGLFAGGSIESLARLAEVATEVSVDPGEVLWSSGDLVENIDVVLRGRLGASGPRTAMGALELLGELPCAKPLVAGEETQLLRIPGEAFFDVLEDHFDLTLQIARDLSRAGGRLHLT